MTYTLSNYPRSQAVVLVGHARASRAHPRHAAAAAVRVNAARAHHNIKPCAKHENLLSARAAFSRVHCATNCTDTKAPMVLRGL